MSVGCCIANVIFEESQNAVPIDAKTDDPRLTQQALRQVSQTGLANVLTHTRLTLSPIRRNRPEQHLTHNPVSSKQEENNAGKY
jgi:hypothetical protein